MRQHERTSASDGQVIRARVSRFVISLGSEPALRLPAALRHAIHSRVMTDSPRAPIDALMIAVPRFRAEVVRGASLPAFVGARAVVGSAADCELRIEERTVSRYHAELSAAPQGIRVRDLGSTNGVVSEGVRLVDAVVPAGTLLELGDVALRVDDTSADREPLPSMDQLGDLVAQGATMRRLLDRAARAAQSDASAWIVGEPGSGKELVARTLHALGPRAQGPFVVVDCGALWGGLVQSELFGHERGAFTDAIDRRIGAFERARGGTLFLDDLGALPAEVQPTLLGALERRRGRRLGGRDEIDYDVRVIASAQRDPRRDVNEGRLRLDLYYRLAVVRLEVPPLRERLDDLPALVERFLRDAGHGPSHPLMRPERLAALESRDWPGNVRELRNAIESALALEELAEDHDTDTAPPAEPMTAAALLESLAERPYKEARAMFARAFEEAYVADLERRAGDNVSRAARLAGLDRSQLRQIRARVRGR